MEIKMASLPKLIIKHIQSLPEGGVISPKAFLHAGSRAAIDQALSRLCKSGKLLRIARGTYTAPVISRFGVRSPAPENVVHALSTLKGEILVPHGASAANMLGLSRQVPIREIYLTAGRSKKLRLGKSEIEIQHTTRWMMGLGNRLAGDAVRALAWMGREHAGKALMTLHRMLPTSEWEALVSARAFLPSRMAEAISQESLHDRKFSSTTPS
jgi:hypothetical protein